MQAQLHRYKAEWIKVDAGSALAYPVLAVTVMTAVGVTLKQGGLLTGWYFSPYLLVVGLIANRVCLRAGLLTAALSALSHEYVFAGSHLSLDWPTPEMLIGYLSTIPLAVVVARRVDWMPPAPMHDTHTSDVMPFTQTDRSEGGSTRYWAVEPSGVWADDVLVGAAYGRVYVDLLRRSAAPPMGWILRDMIKAGKWTGVEAGFASIVAKAASRRRHPSDESYDS